MVSLDTQRPCWYIWQKYRSKIRRNLKSASIKITNTQKSRVFLSRLVKNLVGMVLCTLLMLEVSEGTLPKGHPQTLLDFYFPEFWSSGPKQVFAQIAPFGSQFSERKRHLNFSHINFLCRPSSPGLSQGQTRVCRASTV